MNQSEKTRNNLWYELIKAFAIDKNLDQGSMNVLQFMDENYITPNKYFYALLLQVCAKSGSLIDGKKVHEHLKKTIIRKDIFLNNSLINMYAKCGNLDEAKEIFSNLRKDNIPINIVTWNTLINGYSQKGLVEDAMNLFEEMLKTGLQPDEITFISLLTACANSCSLEQGEKLHKHLKKLGIGKEDVYLNTSLINMYAKCGSLVQAEEIFNSLLLFDSKVSCDTLFWNVMINGYAIHGCSDLAINLFHKMIKRGIHISSVTITCVLLACSHSGLVNGALKIYHSMKSEYNIFPSEQHLNSVLDALCRAGRLEEAEKLAELFPSPSIVTWKTILGGCRIHYDLERLERFAERVLKLDPNDGSICVGLQHIQFTKKKR